VTATTKRAPGRPKTPLDVAEHQRLVRIASLGSAIMQTLRKPEYRGRYSSERELRLWLSESDIAYTSADISPALDLLANVGFIHRAAAPASSSRGGWIPPTVEWSTETPTAPSEEG
jgi:hypothetical protein